MSAHIHRNDNPLVFLAAIAPESSPSSIPPPNTLQNSASLNTPPRPLHTATSTTLVLVFGSEDVRVKEVWETLKLKLGVKGGGEGPRWSGRWVGVWRPAKDGGVVGRAAGGIPIQSQTPSQIRNLSDISACDSYAPCAIPRVLILQAHSRVARSQSCLVFLGAIRG